MGSLCTRSSDVAGNCVHVQPHHPDSKGLLDVIHHKKPIGAEHMKEKMTHEEASALLTTFTTNVADWQRSASAGRGAKTSSEKAAKAMKRLYLALTGKEPTDEQVIHILSLSTVGLV